MIQDYCEVTGDGIAHLFVGFDYGRVCVCGRKVFGFAVDGNAPGLHDVAAAPELSAVYLRRAVPATPLEWAADWLLALGEGEIRRARRARSEAQSQRAWNRQHASPQLSPALAGVQLTRRT